MKIQKLTIHNIASIEDADIDFEASPLVDSEVFLITGNTGSGKSTILDAICLALYADTPRLDGAKMDGGTKDGDVNITINDPRQLLRKNTGEAFASLTFTGNNGTHYKATWSIARAYKKPTGNLQSKEWVLENLDTGQKLTKDAEIKKEIEVVIGLDFEQFRRTTLLAQGEFTRFLNSPDKEKATILEKITGVDVYSKIGKKIYEETTKKKTDWETAQRLVAEMSNPSDDEIALKKEEIKALDDNYTVCKQQQDKDKEKLQWIKTDLDLTAGLASAQKEHNEAIAEAGSDVFKAKEMQVKQWNETMEARGWLRAKKTAEDEVDRQKDVLDRLSLDYAKVLGGFAFAEQERQKTEMERDTLPKIDPLEDDRTRQQLESLRKQQDAAKDMMQNITTTLDRIETYTKARNRRNQSEKDLKDVLVDIEIKKQEAEKIEPKLLEAKAKMDAQRELLDKQKDTIDKFAKTIRQRLQVGDICPVCRQEIKNELPHEDELSQLVSSLTEAFKEAEATYMDLLNKKNKLDAEIKTATRSYVTAKQAFDRDDSVTVAKQKVIDACKACGIETIEKTTPQKLDSLKSTKASTLQDLDKKIKELEELANSHQKAIRQRQEFELKLTAMTAKCQTAKDIIDDLLSLKPEWKSVVATTVEKTTDLTKSANDLHSKTATALARLKQAEETISLNNQQLEAFLQSHKDISTERLIALNVITLQAIAEMNTTLEKVRNKVLTTKTLEEEALKKQEEHRSAKPELSEEDTIKTLDMRIEESGKTLTEIAEKRGALFQEIKTDEQNKKRHGQLDTDAKKKKADFQKWDRLNQYIGDSTGSKFRKIAQSYVLSSLIHSANSYMNTLTDRYTLKVSPGTFVISIEDAYQGFASRAVSTISGGESFLVSLSLALALSDIGQKLAVDTLFIDEGFGSLSGNPLQNAINTLRTLHTKAGRHVGIISHVEELKEKIPVQIQVEQEVNNSNSKITIIP